MFKSSAIKNMTALNQLLGIQQAEDTLYGEYAGYRYSVNIINNGSVLMYQMSMLVNNTLDKDTVKSLQKEIKGTISFSGIDQMIVLQILMNFPISKEKKKGYFNHLMEKLTEVLQQNNIENIESCGFCHLETEENTDWVVYRGLYVPAHASCVSSAYAEQQAAIEAEDANKKNLPISIVLCIVGAIIGILPGVLIMLFSGWLFAIAFALSPVCAFFGYKLGKAPLRWYATLITVITCLVVSLVAVIGMYAGLAALSGMSFNAFISDPDSGFAVTLLQVFLFTALGIAVAWGYIRRINQSKVEK